MIELNYDQTISLLEEVVKGNEDLVYVGPKEDTPGWCSYVAGKNTPGCGVGQVLRKAGVRILDLRRLDHAGQISWAPESIVKLDARARRLLIKFQFHQDRSVSWGEALRRAKASLND